MTSESCPICGEEADADEIDPHGHFSSEDDAEESGGYVTVHLLITGLRKDKLACGVDVESNNSTTGESDVNCPACRETM